MKISRLITLIRVTLVELNLLFELRLKQAYL